MVPEQSPEQVEPRSRFVESNVGERQPVLSILLMLLLCVLLATPFLLIVILAGGEFNGMTIAVMIGVAFVLLAAIGMRH